MSAIIGFPSVSRIAAVWLCIVWSAGCAKDGGEMLSADAAARDEVPGARDGAGLRAGRQIFRHDDFGNWRFWTDTLRLNDLVETVSPAAALRLGLKVDAEAVPEAVLQRVLNNPALLQDPATTLALLDLDAVLGLKATVEGDQIVRIGVTCALCHSTVDPSVVPGIGRRQDGWANRDLAVGTIISLTPGLRADLKAAYASWPPGYYDARFNIDGINAPVVTPPAYGLAGAHLETYTGDGPISYWNNYVAVTQMHGRGSFVDPRIGVSIRVSGEDLVQPKLPALRAYQLSLRAPRPPEGSFDRSAAVRGRLVFRTVARCSGCHGPDNVATLHDPAETGMEPQHAWRSATKKYRATPLRGLWQHAPYFHDGSAKTLADVVAHYDRVLRLGLSSAQRSDLTEYLKSL
jgi:mono/diheme cytochrome c family protein